MIYLETTAKTVRDIDKPVSTHHHFRPGGRQGRSDAIWLRSSLKKVFAVDDAEDFEHLIARFDEQPTRR